MGQVLQFSEALRTGWRRDSRNSANTQALAVCRNLRPTPWGLKDHIPVTQPISAAELANNGIVPTWPFPQLFRGKKETLLADSDTIYRVDETTWGLTPITTYTIYDTDAASQERAITPAGPWHFADFHDVWILFNGACQVFKTGYSDCVYVQDAVTITTGCEFLEGRVLFAGFDEDDYRIQAWQDYLATYMDKIPKAYQANLAKGADANWAWWSTIGGDDLLHLFRLDAAICKTLALVRNGGFTSANAWTLATGWSIGGGALTGSAVTGVATQTDFFGTLKQGATYRVRFTHTTSAGTLKVFIGGNAGAMIITAGNVDQNIVAGSGTMFQILGSGYTGSVTNLRVEEVTGYSTENPFFLDLLKRNESGLMPVPFRNKVTTLKPLARNVIAYGINGVIALTPYSDPTPTFGLVDIQDLWRGVGCAKRSAAGGGARGHVFVDNGGELWFIGPDLKAEKRGYGEVFNGMLANQIVVSYDPQYEHFWIADGEQAYVLNENGLSRAPQIPTTVSFALGGAIGMVFDDADPDGVEVVTEWFTGPEPGKHAEITQIGLITSDQKAQECVQNGDFAAATGWTAASGWAIANGALVHTTSSTAKAEQGAGDQSSPIVIGRTYWVRYKLTRSAGTVTLQLGSGVGVTRSVSGYYVEEITCLGDTTIRVAPSSTFAGSIDNLSIKEKYTGWVAQIYSKASEADAGDLSSKIPIGPRGRADLLVGGVAFRIALKAPHRARVDLERFDVTMRSGAKRNVKRFRYGRQSNLPVVPLGTQLCAVNRIVFFDGARNFFWLQNPDSCQLWADTLLVWNLVYRSDNPDKNGLYTTFSTIQESITGASGIQAIEEASATVWYIAVNEQRRMKIDIAAKTFSFTNEDYSTAPSVSTSKDPIDLLAAATAFQVCDSISNGPATPMSLEDDGSLRLAVPLKFKATQAECFV